MLAMASPFHVLISLAVCACTRNPLAASAAARRGLPSRRLVAALDIPSQRHPSSPVRFAPASTALLLAQGDVGDEVASQLAKALGEMGGFINSGYVAERPPPRRRRRRPPSGPAFPIVATRRPPTSGALTASATAGM